MQCEGHSPDAVTFACVLKACGSIRAAAKGEEIHEIVTKMGMLEKDTVLVSTLVDMYAKCGALGKAQQVIKELPVHNVVSWNALIAGYAQQGQGEEALNCFDDMLSVGHSPDAVTFICTLKACGSIGAAAKGEEVYEKIVSMGMLKKNIVLGNSLVDMYAKCGALAKAHQVLQELPKRDVVSWTTLIAGHAQQGQGEEALKWFDDMLYEGHLPNAVTFICVLKACGNIGAVAKGEEIHEKIVRMGMLMTNTALGNTLVDMYARCGALAKAYQVLKELPMRDVVSWTALIAGHVQQGQGEEALKCFDDMLREGHSPNAVTFACALRACGSIGAAAKGVVIHEKIIGMGMLGKDVVLQSTLVDMYARCGAIAKAHQVLKVLPIRDVVSWTAVIAGHAQQEQGEEALRCYDGMLLEGHTPDAVTFACALNACGNIGAAAKGEEIHEKSGSMGMLEKNIVLGSTLVGMYAKCGALTKAYKVLKELPMCDTVSWNALIAGYSQRGQGEAALKCLRDMLCEGYCPDAVTFTHALKACGSIGAVPKGEEILSIIVNVGMLEKDIGLGTALVDMYAKCNALTKAHQVLKQLPMRNVVSWNALIAGYAEQGQGEKALKCCKDMTHDGPSPDAVTFTCALKACGRIGAAAIGEEIHENVVSMDILKTNVVLGNTLIDMYAKCHALTKAHQVHKELPIRDVVSWTVLIAGHAQKGQGKEALKCFDDMLYEGHSPDAITFCSVLKACGSIRATTKGEEIHEKIFCMGMLEKNIVLGNALLNMYTKCGEFIKAHEVFKQLPMRDVFSWNVLIAGYAHQGQGEEALKCYDDMLHEGYSPDAVTFSCVLNACGSIRTMAKGEEIHEKIVRMGMLKKNIVLGNTLVDMYAKCGILAKAYWVFKELPMHDLVSWNALIAGYVRQGLGNEALRCFDDMLHEGYSPDVVTFICVLKACMTIGAAAKGEEILDKYISMDMLKKNIVLGNTLVDMYAKCGGLAKAHQVLKKLSMRGVVSWNALITGYVQQGRGEEALKCCDDMRFEGLSPDAVSFACMLKACGSIGAAAKAEEIYGKITSMGMLENDIVLGSMLVDTYAKCGALDKAQQVHKELPVRDAVSWNALIGGYAQEGQGEEALKCFEDMLCEGHSPNGVTFICVLKACGSIGALAKGEQVHEKIVNLGMLEKDVVLQNSLIHMYANCGAHAKARRVLEELPVGDVVSWSALISGYAQKGQNFQAVNCFEQMQSKGVKPCSVTLTIVLNICSHSGLLDEAETYFSGMNTKLRIHPSLEQYCCMIDAFARAGKFNKALSMIAWMPYDKCLSSWFALLGASRKWKELKVGTLAFESILSLDKHNVAVYVLMADIYRAAGMPEEAHAIEVMRVAKRV